MTPNSKTERTDGVVEHHEDGLVTLRFQRRLDHPVDRVWAALTEPDELAGWLAEADLELVEGGSIELRWRNELTRELVEEYDIKGFEGRDPEQGSVARGRITRLDPPRMIEYDTDAHGVMRWELEVDDGGCLLSFSSTVEIPEEMRTQVLAGWHSHLDWLEDALAGHPIDWSSWQVDQIDHWAAHRERYEAQLG
jgi:uncharacterized protein YndB with AHSA1/START domain